MLFPERSSPPILMSALEGSSDRICSVLVFPVLTHQRHWLCTAATVLMPGLSPIKVLV